MPTIDIKINKRVFNDVYYPYLDNDDRYLIFYGGGSSGKSFFIAQRYIYKLLTRKRCNLLVVRQTGDTNRKSTFPLFKQVIKQWNLSKYFKINESDMRIRSLLNGNEIAFIGLDDVEKVKSITFENGELTDEWIEEATETQEADINQLKVRLRGGSTKKQMVLSFNPVNINHWIKRHFIDSGLATICFSTYKDNKFLTEDDRKALEDLKHTDEYTYNVYCLGQWGVLGKTVFDARLVSKRLQELPKILKQGYFAYNEEEAVKGRMTEIRWIPDRNGYITIYETPNLSKYCIGGDTAGEGSDYFIGQVLDVRTGKQVAVLRQELDADLYAKQLYCLGWYYKSTNIRGEEQPALIGIESNFDSHPIKELERLGYLNQYIREEEDTYTGKLTKKFGFRTDRNSRPRVISQLIQIVRESVFNINDKNTLEEMLTFVRNEKGRPEAQEGAHDDLIMALAIAYDIKDQVLFDEEVLTPYKTLAESWNVKFEVQEDYGEEIQVI